MTEFLRTPVGGTTVVGLALLCYGGLLAWARQPGHAGRSAVALSATALGLLVALLNLVLGTAGAWQSPNYSLPLVVLAAYYLLIPSVLSAMLLMGYRWLAGRTPRPLLLYAAIMLAVAGPLVVVLDEWAIERGYVILGRGYMVWMDALVGVALLWLPALLYEGLRRWQERSAHRRTARSQAAAGSARTIR